MGEEDPGLVADHLGANPHSTARNRVTPNNRGPLHVDFLAGTVGSPQLGTARSLEPVHTRLCPEASMPRSGPKHRALPQGTSAVVADLCDPGMDPIRKHERALGDHVCRP